MTSALHGLLDDARSFDPNGPGIHQASASFSSYAPLARRFEVLDTDLPLLRGSALPLQVVLSGGAGQVAGPAGLARRLGLDLAGIRLALRDYDDLTTNVRRVAAAVDAARSAGDLAEETDVSVELPVLEAGLGWVSAAQEAAMSGLGVSYRLGGEHPDQVPSPAQVADWIDTALDQELPFTISRGLTRAVRDPEGRGHGFLNVLGATQAAWDGADRRVVEAVLSTSERAPLVADLASWGSARRWFTGFSTMDPDQALADLRVLGLFDSL